MLFPTLDDPRDTPGLRFPDGALTWRELRDAAVNVADGLAAAGCRRIAVWAEPTLDTAVAVIGALVGGVTVVPLNPGIGSLELDHILKESRPDAILCGRDRELPAALAPIARHDVREMRDARKLRATPDTHVARARAEAPATALPPPPPAEAPALIIYTSGTTGLPKGAVLPYRALAANLDGLAEVWQWTARDVLVHALPLFHVHGLVLGTLGPARVGSPLVHVARFSPEAIASALADDGGTMLFGVPTMYHRLAKAAETDSTIVDALTQARVLISGSAPLASQDRETIVRLTGRSPIERYGLTETLIVCAMPPATPADACAGVGPAVPGVEVRLVDDQGAVIPPDTPDALGEVEVRGPSLFTGYLDRPDATAAALHDGWFRTGDTARRDPRTGSYTIVGRTALDVIKTGGFKVGAGEVEDALRLHPDVVEVAVTGEADADLGQRIVAWVVPRPACGLAPADLDAHAARLLASHKRPRAIHYLEALPRNAMGKVEKRKLTRGR